MTGALCVTDITLDDEHIALRTADGVITDLGRKVTPDAGDEVLDGRGHALIPGLVNGHGHAAMTLLRGFGDDLPLMRWLETRIWPAETRLTRDDVYWGTRLACLEMIRAANMKLAVGRAFPYPAARSAGIPIGLGTDGAASNNSLDLLAEPKLLTLLQKHAAVDAAVLPRPTPGRSRPAPRRRASGGRRCPPRPIAVIRVPPLRRIPRRREDLR